MLRRIKNWIGSLKGFGACPNCGDSWWWKSFSGISYSRIEGKIGLFKTMTEGIPFFGVDTSITICKECKSNPENLNLDKIRQNLEKCPSWDIDAIEIAINAISAYKANPIFPNSSFI